MTGRIRARERQWRFCSSRPERSGDLSEESKRSHWMWWIFPQITGVGMTSTSQEYSIKSLAEAKAYLEHPVLDKFFDGKKDTRTLAILRQIGE